MTQNSEPIVNVVAARQAGQENGATVYERTYLVSDVRHPADAEDAVLASAPDDDLRILKTSRGDAPLSWVVVATAHFKDDA